MVILMYATLMKFDGVMTIVLEIIGGLLMAAVAIGFNTKLCALILVMLLTVQNTMGNAFWMEPAHSSIYDYKKYDFFQTLSVIGGLLYVVALGPGGLALDEAKKKY
jgi:uncharacterized membrane protein YphA (DoxX/SURF4 family)